MSSAKWRQFASASVCQTLHPMLFTGYENERYIHICKLESRNLVCEAGTFLWIRSVSVGVSSNHVVDANTGAISCPITTSDDCLKPTLRYREGTTYRVFNGLNVPDEMVMWGGDSGQLCSYPLQLYWL